MNRHLLMVAYQCGPDMGSVSQIGWEWYSRMARRRPVTLITHSRNRVAIEARGGVLPGSEIHYIDTEWLAGPLYRMACRLFPGREHAIFLLSSLDYFLFDRLALRLARRWHKEGASWGAVHVPTPVSSAAGSCLDRLGLPLLRGPLNCGLGNPAGFDRILQQESQWLNVGRRLGQWWSAWLERQIPRRVTLTATRATRQVLPPVQRAQSMMLLENGIDPEQFVPSPWPARPGPSQPLRVLFVGRMLAMKGVEFLLRAVARLIHDEGINVELTLAGDGARRREFEKLAAELNIADACKFTGNLPLRLVPELMRECHVFCLPSVRESGGAVLLEAMACARPVIAFNYGGPAELVTPQTGVLLDAANPAELVDGLKRSLFDCYRNPQHWDAMGRAGAALLHAPHQLGFSWEDKLDIAEELYASLAESESVQLSGLPVAGSCKQQVSL
ncbi:glycosyltransferase family 4 protein [Chitinilyticum piscinae]|uniref:Glycosyltransferase n=1 Tax=Chitinilyticum piscinae TaxID=2866724 RepID=A0A8J7FHW3_9NEIS|nr:glycosyltransferase [Chitinilyticum piscinae]MBE9609565.1 glycosyltransferase [Chitinilyticum piscinae]